MTHLNLDLSKGNFLTKWVSRNKLLSDGFKYVLCLSRKLGEMIQFDDHVFFKWVETQPPTSETCQ